MVPSEERSLEPEGDQRPGLPEHLPREDRVVDVRVQRPVPAAAAWALPPDRTRRSARMLRSLCRRSCGVWSRIRLTEYGLPGLRHDPQAPAPERPIAKGMATPALRGRRELMQQILAITFRFYHQIQILRPPAGRHV